MINQHINNDYSCITKIMSQNFIFHNYLKKKQIKTRGIKQEEIIELCH